MQDSEQLRRADVCHSLHITCSFSGLDSIYKGREEGYYLNYHNMSEPKEDRGGSAVNGRSVMIRGNNTAIFDEHEECDPRVGWKWLEYETYDSIFLTLGTNVHFRNGQILDMRWF